jgi:protein ImuB
VRFVERVSLDWAVESLEPLAFVLRGALDRLVQRLTLRGFFAGDLQLTLEYEGPGRHICSVRAGAPSRDVRALLSLCRLVLAKTPPEQPVTQVVVQAAPATSRPRQLSFFEPTGPAPDKLAVTVARLAALCGPERVGAPVPADSYADDAFQVAPFDGSATSSPERPEAPPVALKRFRPPRPVELIWRRGVPIRLEGTDLGGRVVSWRGPFRRSEGWWNDERDPDAVHGDCDVYDLQLSSGVAYRVAFDRCCSRWLAQGWYD